MPMGVPATQQLTEFLTVVADRAEGPAAQHAAVACAARTLDATIAVLMIDHAVVATVGLDPEQAAGLELTAVGAGRRSTLDVAGRRHAVTFATIDGHSPGLLVLARPGPAFSAEEVCLLRGMARVLELSLQTLHAVASERRQALENDRLVGSLRERERLFEQLSGIQRAIARRAPLQQILD